MAADPTHDAFLGGKLHLWQPRAGYRAGVDPVFLAASVPAKPGQSVLDLGCGVGAAALCLGARIPDLSLTGVERNPLYAELALRNGLDCVQADLARLPTELRSRAFDHVIANPPYYDRDSGQPAPDSNREDALGEATPLETWIDVAARRLRPKGYLHVIHHATRLPDLLACCTPRLGAIEVKPLAPRTGRKSELVLLRARKEGRTPFVLHPPTVLHEGQAHLRDAESYTPEIRAVLRDGAALKW